MPSKAELKAVEENIFGKSKVQKSAVRKAGDCKAYVEEEYTNYMAIRSTSIKLMELVENGLSISMNYGVSASKSFYRDMIDSLEDFMDSAGIFTAKYLDEEQLKSDIESEYLNEHGEE